MREWLTRKQRETRRGRAELVLSERAAIWSAKPELRHLPNLMEWASIRWHTRPKEWSEPQARMMRRAGWFNAVRAILLSGVAAVLAVVGVNVWDYGLAVDSVNDLLLAETHSVERLLRQIADHRRWADPKLRQILTDPKSRSRDTLLASLALLPVDPKQVEHLVSRVPDVTADEVGLLSHVLKPYRDKVVPSLWRKIEEVSPKAPSIRPLAAALANLDPDDSRWERIDRNVAEAMVTLDPASLGSWLGPLRPVRAGSFPGWKWFFVIQLVRSCSVTSRRASSQTTPATIRKFWPTC